jgi:hypothetical protein
MSEQWIGRGDRARRHGDGCNLVRRRGSGYHVTKYDWLSVSTSVEGAVTCYTGMRIALIVAYTLSLQQTRCNRFHLDSIIKDLRLLVKLTYHQARGKNLSL